MLVDLSGAVLQRSVRSPNLTFQDYITVEEDPDDDAQITRHPVDSGAIMSDHIILMPPEVKLRLGWSNADPASTGPSYVRDVYSKLLQLKNARQLFTVYTGKRFYTNMFVASLRGPVTNARYEWSMIVDLLLRQLLLVDLAAPTSAPTSVNAAANGQSQNLASPESNQPTVNTGLAQATVTTLDPSTVSGLSASGQAGASSSATGIAVITNNHDGGAGPYGTVAP